MGFFDYIKKINLFERKETGAGVESTEEKSKELSLNEIREKLASKQRELSEKNEELNKKTKLLVKDNISLLKSCLNSLKAVNLDNRKEEEKLKEIVIENVNIYASYLEKFIIDLENFDNISQITRLFDDFSKNSNKSYQKGTILVGKEFEEIRNVFKKFVLDFNLLIKENQENNHKINKFKEFNARFNEITKTLDVEKEIREDISKLKEIKEKKEAEIIKNKNELHEIINSSHYNKDLEEKEKVKVEIKKLEDEIYEVLIKINLKELAKIYHGNEKKNRIIQEYIRDYKKAIEEDKDRNFEKIVKEARGESINLVERYNKINELKKQVFLNEIKRKQIEDLIENIEEQIKELSENINKEEKKISRFEDKRQEIESKLKLEAGNVLGIDKKLS
ncbi:MAG: hypothetical protein WC781_01590 [Candidatus Pacearchaeota archaeon]|jgi:hypothetical protein